MGQYHKVVNLDKKQFLHPHRLGDGLKLGEFGCSSHGTMTALAYLLGVSTGRGGGDFDRGSLAGTWGGDRIAIIGDYAEAKDLAPEHDAANLYEKLSEEADGWKDISGLVAGELPGDISAER
jgi:hypothetical protein